MLCGQLLKFLWLLKAAAGKNPVKRSLGSSWERKQTRRSFRPAARRYLQGWPITPLITINFYESSPMG